MLDVYAAAGDVTVICVALITVASTDIVPKGEGPVKITCVVPVVLKFVPEMVNNIGVVAVTVAGVTWVMRGAAVALRYGSILA